MQARRRAKIEPDLAPPGGESWSSRSAQVNRRCTFIKRALVRTVGAAPTVTIQQANYWDEIADDQSRSIAELEEVFRQFEPPAATTTLARISNGCGFLASGSTAGTGAAEATVAALRQ